MIEVAVAPPHPAPFPGLLPDAYEGRPGLLGLNDGLAEKLRVQNVGLCTYSPRQDRDLTDVPITDFGDLQVPDLATVTPNSTTPDLSSVLAAAVQTLMGTKTLPVILGQARHLLPGVVQGLLPIVPDLSLVQVSAHADFEPISDDSAENSVISLTATMINEAKIRSFGVRNGSRDAFAKVQDQLPGRGPLALAFDFSVFEPSLVPVARPDAGGWGWANFESFLAEFPWERTKVCVLTGLDAQRDHNQGFAAKVLREILLKVSPQEA